MLEKLSTWLMPEGAHSQASSEALEALLSEALVDAGVWQGRASDGVHDFRVVSDAPERARICGDVWTIDQVLHVFWLDLSKHDDVVEWVLFYDLHATPRRLRAAVHVLEAPDQGRWATRLSGRAALVPLRGR